MLRMSSQIIFPAEGRTGKPVLSKKIVKIRVEEYDAKSALTTEDDQQAELSDRRADLEFLRQANLGPRGELHTKSNKKNGILFDSVYDLTHVCPQTRRMTCTMGIMMLQFTIGDINNVK